MVEIDFWFVRLVVILPCSQKSWQVVSFVNINFRIFMHFIFALLGRLSFLLWNPLYTSVCGLDADTFFPHNLIRNWIGSIGLLTKFCIIHSVYYLEHTQRSAPGLQAETIPRSVYTNEVYKDSKIFTIDVNLCRMCANHIMKNESWRNKVHKSRWGAQIGSCFSFWSWFCI